MARERMLAGKAADPSANLREGSEPSRKASDDAAAAVSALGPRRTCIFERGSRYTSAMHEPIKSTSFRLAPETLAEIARISDKLRISRTAVVDLGVALAARLSSPELARFVARMETPRKPRPKA